MAKTYIGYGEDGRPFDVVAEIQALKAENQAYLDKIAVLEKENEQLKRKTEVSEVKVVKKHER